MPNSLKEAKGSNYCRKQLKLKNSFQNSFKSCKISTLTSLFSVLWFCITTASSDQHISGLARHGNTNII